MNKKIKLVIIILNIIIIGILGYFLTNDLENYSKNDMERFGKGPDMMNMQADPPEKPSEERSMDIQQEEHTEQNLKENVNDFNAQVNLSNEKILVNSEEISNNEESKIYLTTSMNNGGMLDESKKSNIEIDNVININAPGGYEFSGTLENGQIAVNANGISGNVNIILNNVDIKCTDAPAIFIYSKDVENKNCKVTITLKENSVNTITGGKIKQSVEGWSDQNDILYYIEKDYDDNRQYYERYKYDGAISSDVSLVFDGTGTLNVNSSKKEGIESKMNITINSGTYNINSADDGINACAEGKSVITMNDGKILVNVSKDAEEGDGIDSNGSITINGGTICSFACPGSDNGLDADMGIYINGGTVLSTGSMSEKITSNNDTKIVQMNFNKDIEKDENILIVDENENIIFAYKTDRKISTFAYSSENLGDKTYAVYTGKEVNGNLDENGVYTEVTSFDLSKMTKQENSETNRGFGEHSREFNNSFENQNLKIKNILMIVIVTLIINVIILVYDLLKK